MAKMKTESDTQFGRAIQNLLEAIDCGIAHKNWLRGQLRKKGFVYKAYNKTEDKIKRKRFSRYIIEEQNVIAEFRLAIKVLKQHANGKPKE